MTAANRRTKELRRPSRLSSVLGNGGATRGRQVPIDTSRSVLMRVRASRWSRCFATTLACIALPAAAGPLVLEESARLVSPDPDFTLDRQVAVEGDFIIATGTRYNYQEGNLQRRGYLFRRNVDASWSSVRTLFSDQADLIIGPPDVAVAMGEGIAAISHASSSGAGSDLKVFQRVGADYVPAPRWGIRPLRTWRSMAARLWRATAIAAGMRSRSGATPAAPG